MRDPEHFRAQSEEGVAEKPWLVHRHLDNGIYALAGKCSDETDEYPGPQPMPILQNRGAHRQPLPRIARIPASSRCRAAPTAAAIVISKMASSLRPAAVSPARSVSVMR